MTNQRLNTYPYSSDDQKKAEDRGQKAEGIYPDSVTQSDSDVGASAVASLPYPSGTPSGNGNDFVERASADSTSHLATDREQGFQAPCEQSSLAPVQAGIQTSPERNLLPSAFCLLPSPEGEREKQRQAAEKQRDAAEQKRQQAENQRALVAQQHLKLLVNWATAEEQRLIDEELRGSTEAERQESEEQRCVSEQSRTSAEKSRQAAEKLRQATEEARVVAEMLRQAAEDVRQATHEQQLVLEEMRHAAQEFDRIHLELRGSNR